MRKKSLNALNTVLFEIAGTYNNIGTIPPLPKDKFHTVNDHIHWTTQTANDMLNHWVNHLNLKIKRQ